MNVINRIVIGLAVGAVVLPVAAEDAVTWDTWPDTWWRLMNSAVRSLRQTAV